MLIRLLLVVYQHSFNTDNSSTGFAIDFPNMGNWDIVNPL
jgi:hypothetical protein